MATRGMDLFGRDRRRVELQHHLLGRGAGRPRPRAGLRESPAAGQAPPRRSTTTRAARSRLTNIPNSASCEPTRPGVSRSAHRRRASRRITGQLPDHAPSGGHAPLPAPSPTRVRQPYHLHGALPEREKVATTTALPAQAGFGVSRFRPPPTPTPPSYRRIEVSPMDSARCRGADRPGRSAGHCGTWLRRLSPDRAHPWLPGRFPPDGVMVAQKASTTAGLVVVPLVVRSAVVTAPDVVGIVVVVPRGVASAEDRILHIRV